MIEFVYNLLASAGFTHPLHPVMTHIPMGMVIGGFIFQAASFRWEALSKTAHHCIVLALLFVPLTALLGFMDWQHRYMGYVSGLIIVKMILALTLFILLSVSVYLYRRRNPGMGVMTLLYALNLLNAAGLGFLGGVLIFG